MSNASDPFVVRATLEAIPPLVTAVIGTLGVGLFTTRIVEGSQRRRGDREARQQIAIEMTKIASALYYATQLFIRSERSAEDRHALSDEYHRRRVAGNALEMRVRAYLPGTMAAADWHAVLDLLTVRYLHAIDQATDESLERNAGPQHSGLSVEQLRDPELVRSRYLQRLTDATSLVIAPAKQLPGSVRGRELR